MLKMAIMGAGNIAGKMASTIAKMDSVEAYAVGARDPERAQKFADTYGFRKAYGSYEELAADQNIDLVYVAVPHSHHFRAARLAIEAGRNVLCEKSFTVNASQAEELIRMAEEKGVLITEAIWTRYMPSRQIIQELIQNGAIGDLRSIYCNLCYKIDQVERITDPNLAGGALLDLGVYGVHFTRMILGDAEPEIETSAVFDHGVDMAETITMKYPGNILVSMQFDATCASDRIGILMGTRGYMEIQNINNPEEIRVYDENHRLTAVHPVPEQITGYEYEVLSCADAIASHKLECPEIPHSETIAVMKILDQIRKFWKYEIPDVR